ncbi:MAG: M4 family metallopeptidase [Pseudomonadota bacterium]|nr:M4 family metallopeptidase [Pseudomonadota bacterium]
MISLRLSCSVVGAALLLATGNAPAGQAAIEQLSMVRELLEASSDYVDLSGDFAVSASDEDAANRARIIARTYRQRLGLNQHSDFAVTRTVVDPAGRRHIRLAQTFDGVPVFGGAIVVHFAPDGRGESITGNPLRLQQPFRNALRIGKAQAARTAVASLSAERASAKSVELVVLDSKTVFRKDGEPRRAYKVTVTGPGRRDFVFIDASTGATLGTLSGIHSARDRYTYDMHNSTFYATASLERAEGDIPTGDTDIDQAHDFAGDTYDFFFNAYGRDGINGAGLPIRSYTHYGINYLNAFWDGTRLTYGDGFPIDDIVGHEITHGVTEYSANLIYLFEPGALSESFSDIFGEIIDQINGVGSDGIADRWLVGEDLPGFGAIRNMKNPPAFGDPDRIGSPNYYCGLQDNGGVHINSGVPNKNFTLLVDGGTFNGIDVQPIGLTKASAIHYHSLTNYLTPLSNMRAHFLGLWRSCWDLRGVALNDPATGAPSGDAISWIDCQQVLRAGAATQLWTPPCR